MMPDRTTCERAVASRDTRWDGVFYTGVTSTGIYCRPSCPAMTPHPANMTFHASAAAAAEAGFRACRRCRPDAVPGSPAWDLRADTAGRALREIADGAVERDGVSGLAARLAYSPRQLQRLLLAEVGAGPLALARIQRATTARSLAETTDLPFTEVAFASGFGSIRSFNETIRRVFDLAPRELRTRARARNTPRKGGSAHGNSGAPEPHHDRGTRLHAAPLTIRVRLPFRTPFEPDQLFGHLIATAIPGIEEWDGTACRRTLRLPRGPGLAALTPPRPGTRHIDTAFTLADPRDLRPAVARCRRMLDLDADPVAIDAHLAESPQLAASVAAHPGRRVPRTVDGPEFAIRAILGQQISTARAAALGARLVQRCGDPLPAPSGSLTHLFPSPDTIAGLHHAEFPMPRSRARAILAVAGALAAGDVDLSPGADRTAARTALAAIPGIGPWTVEVIAMRALGDPDAFPATDLGVIRGAHALGIDNPARAAEAWRPWRAYAGQHLWAAHDHPINRIPIEETP